MSSQQIWLRPLASAKTLSQEGLNYSLYEHGRDSVIVITPEAKGSVTGLMAYDIGESAKVELAS